jgi:NitT/TauT family transport system ATP-binding protein
VNAPDKTNAASIRAVEVTKQFGAFTAVDHLSLDIKSGEFVSLIGPSGCGKSTFMLMAAGLIPATAGEITVDGRTLNDPLTDIGIVFQDHLLLEFRTAIENVMLQAEIRGLPLEPARKRAEDLFGRLGIAHATNRYPRQLSGGMRQRVAIARALIHDPSILMMDEPFGALDAITRTQIRHDLELLWLDTRKTVLFITHSLEEAISLSDRVIVMSPTPGRIVDEIQIDLPRPRPAHLGDYPSFNVYADRIHDTFKKFGILKY